MINPGEDDFMQDEPLGSRQTNETQGTEDLQFRTKTSSVTAGERWEQAKEKAAVARERTEYFLRENPIPTIIGALTIGLAIGWALRYATDRDEKEIEIKSPLGNVNWSFLSLPFLWPFLKSMREKYEDSTEVIKDGVGQLKKIDVERYTKPMRKRWKAWTD
jgi:ElaB/YqjD/DUF883 family membrane-anchored ribosome-binding protein